MRDRRTRLRGIGIGVILLASGAAAGFEAARLGAATPPPEASAELGELSVEEIRRRLHALEDAASAALADEDYALAARLRREMTRLEDEIVRRDREGIPTRPPNFRVPRR